MIVKKFIHFFAYEVTAEAAGISGVAISQPAVQQWYSGLIKPVFAPANSVFAPVWAFLYFLMGLSAYLVWEKRDELNIHCKALYLFFIQLVLNVAWSLLFFGLRSPIAALAEIVLLWMMIIYTAIESYKVSKTAGLLYIPYILWVAFAAVLNASIVVMNR